MRRAAAGLVCLTALLAAGCGTGGTVPASADKAGGKPLFVKNCGSCHTLAAAGTLGKVGPNLDDSFAASREQGFKESTITNIVHSQISQAIAPMPKNLVTGADADAVAAYVGSVAGLPVGGATTGGTPTTAPPLPAPTTTEATTTEETTTEATTTAATTTTQATGGGDAAKGEALYTSLGCAGCHSIDGSTGTGPTLKGIYGSEVELEHGVKVQGDEQYLLDSIFDPDKQIADGFTPGLMSAVIKPGSVSQADARALVAYIKTLK